MIFIPIDEPGSMLSSSVAEKRLEKLEAHRENDQDEDEISCVRFLPAEHWSQQRSLTVFESQLF